MSLTGGVYLLLEVPCRSNKAQGFGILNLAWGVGSVAGPVVSGLLAQPCTQYAWQVCPAVLSNYPFLLPCLAAAFFSLLGIIASMTLRETLQGTQSAYQLIASDAYLQQSETESQFSDPTSFMEDVECEALISRQPDIRPTQCTTDIHSEHPVATGSGATATGNLLSKSTGSRDKLHFVNQGIGEPSHKIVSSLLNCTFHQVQPPLQCANHHAPQQFLAPVDHGNNTTSSGALRFIIRAKPGLELEMIPRSKNLGMPHMVPQHKHAVRESDLQVAKIVSSGACRSREDLRQRLRNILLFPTIAPLLRDRDVLLSSLCYSMTGLVFIITGSQSALLWSPL